MEYDTAVTEITTDINNIAETYNIIEQVNDSHSICHAK